MGDIAVNRGVLQKMPGLANWRYRRSLKWVFNNSATLPRQGKVWSRHASGWPRVDLSNQELSVDDLTEREYKVNQEQTEVMKLRQRC